MKIVWDKIGERFYETGVRNGVFYSRDTTGAYPKAVAWNGLTGVTESPSGAEATSLYADDIEYVKILAAEKYGATIEALYYPPEFEECDGTAEIAPGVQIGQQNRKTFGMTYKSVLGNDLENEGYGYKIHLIYGALAAPSEKPHATINDSPESITFSWEISTTPVAVTGFKPTASLVIDSTKVDADKLKTLEDILYGTDGTEADGDTGTDGRLPLPDEIATLMAAA